MAAKIDKKELEEPDKLQLFFLSVRAFAEKNRTAIYTATGIFILHHSACRWLVHLSAQLRNKRWEDVYPDT